MEVSLPEHRIYTVLAAFQAAFVMIGTFAIRVVTSESFYVPQSRVHWYAYAVRNWGYLLLPVPLGCLVWALRDMRSDPEGRRSGRRIAIGILLTLCLGSLLWVVWERSAPMSESGGSESFSE